MNVPFLRVRRARRATASDRCSSGQPRHAITSDFDTSVCRFVLDCTCGDHFDTRYIDEALEYRELHLELAPLTDRLSGAATS